VKVGSGAFVRDIHKARELAQTMITIGTTPGRKVGAAITDMNQPLGNAVGNALEVAEAIEILRGGGPQDLRTLCVELCALLLYMSEQCRSLEDARAQVVASLDSGEALKKLAQIIASQDGNPAVTNDLSLLPKANITHEIISPESGYINEINCSQIGIAASLLGAGRERKEDTVDPAVGIIISKKLGERVETGEPLAILYANDPSKVTESESVIIGAYKITGTPMTPPPLVHEISY